METTEETPGAGRTTASRDRVKESPARSRAVGERFVAIWDCARQAAGLAEIDAVFAPTFVNHDPITGPTREDYKRELALFCGAFPDLLAGVHLLVADGDLVVVRWTARGTYAGGLDFLGINDGTATGRAVTLKGIDILRVERGVIVERWGEFDTLGMIRQLNTA